MRTENELPVIHDGATATGRLTRREMVQRLIAGVTWSVGSAAHPFYEHLRNGTVLDVQDRLPIIDWKPVFLNQFQSRRLVVLAERIVPGSEKAQVNRFIDLLLSVDNEKHQRDFIDALAAFETESGKRFGKRLPALDGAQLDEILTDASTNKVAAQETSGGREENSLYTHFENLKGWVSGAYYSSEKGMRELGWTEDRVFEKFPGCEHPEGHH